jgi:hypothetical protein
MAIIQISKIQVRSGNLVDLPQLDEAEIGWASDDKRLFIGKTTPNENIEILTSYSNIDFSQLTGSYGNLNITSPKPGQVLSYNATSNAWLNAGGNALDPGAPSYWSSQPIHLGNVANLFIGGGAVGYILETDGKGNLSWTPKGTLYTNINAISSASTGIMTVANSTPYTNGQEVTITGVAGTNANTVVNGKSFYVKLAIDFPTTGNVSLYTDAGLTTGLNTSTLTATANTGIATAVIVGGGSGGGGAGGTTSSVQYNYGGVITGDSDFTWNNSSATLSVTGTANVSGNINSSANVVASRLVSNIATGTAPLVVTSTTRVSNLNVATSGVANTVNDAAQANITSVGTLTSLSVSGNANVGNLGTGGLITATGNIRGGNLTTGGALSVTGNANVGNIGAAAGVFTTVTGTLTTAAQPNITSTGTLTSISVSGNANVGNLGTAGLITATGNITGGNIIGIIRPTGGNGTAGIIFPADPGGGSGDLATIKYYANVGESTILELAVTNDPDDIIKLNATGGTTITNTLTTTSISAGANTTAGSITGNWTLTSGSRMQATYADLAEYYEADQHYESGTVLAFGGDKEVTLAEDGTTRVAGVVSTDPAYVMNSGCEGIAVAIALQGRVPTKVRGTVRKGDMMVSAGNGFARPWNNPQLGTIIGKALENFDGIEGVIEIAVGRL